jgi:endonuclease-3 related protein
MFSDKLMEIHDLLYDRYGAQHWWPGESTIEIIVGAILTQNTNWGNVEKAIANLKAAKVLAPAALFAIDAARLSELIRPAGYYNIKTKRLKNFMAWLFQDRFCGDLELVAQMSTDILREELLGIKGVGPETADSILLYAFDKPVFVIDTYTCRVLGRHGLLEPDSGYEQVKDLFESYLPGETKLFNEYHALLVKVGKEHCRPKAKCHNCPLESLPHQLDELY